MRRLFPLMAVLLICGCISVDVSLFGKEGELKERNITDRGYEHKILVIPIDGIIHQERFSCLFYSPSSTPAYLDEQLKKAEGDEDICAVILRISSPGGEVSASDTMYKQLVDFRKRTNKPVVAYFTDIGTSGAYYIACAADRIVAQPTSITGSVGVIVHLLNIEELLGKVGVSVEVIKSGKRKDTGSPFRKLTDEERLEFQKLVDGLYERFLRIVKESRRLSGERIEAVADGRVMSASDALSARLIDGICYFEGAIKVAKELAGIKEADLVLYERRGRRHSLYAPSALSVFERRVLRMLRPGFYYITEEFFWGSE